jgi:hypothetical protein
VFKKYLLFRTNVKLLSSHILLLLLGIVCLGTVKILCLTVIYNYTTKNIIIRSLTQLSMN